MLMKVLQEFEDQVYQSFADAGPEISSGSSDCVTHCIMYSHLKHKHEIIIRIKLLQSKEMQYNILQHTCKP